ncbi:putative DNA binding domain-containing protein [Treponema sp. TIM-1]|uniref:RNA-binding domain-containing protein n=1 Tax=Treponema sp. TIM-1 TaxID=2898417 RepID=UPI00397EBDBB
MLKSELLEIIDNGENSGVEFKRDDLRPEQVAKEIVALANFQGGRLLLGVEDDGTISGISREDLETWIMDTVFNRYVHPLIIPFYEEIKIDEKRRVAVISFPQGTEKPYVLRNKGREEIYIRLGSTSRLATREQQARLFQSGGMVHTELPPLYDTDLDCLDLARLKDYLVNIIGDEGEPENRRAWEKRLAGLGFMKIADHGEALCTIAGILLFARNPRKYVRFSGLRWMSFAGTDMSYQAQDDTFINAPLVALGKGKPGDGRYIEDRGLIEIAIDRMGPFISEESDTLKDLVRREREYRYPTGAIREAILNGMAHRDWTKSLEVEAVNYHDRIEIMSPGALQNSMTLEAMLAGQRSVRNPVIREVLRDYGYVDARGMGVRRKIIPLTKELTGKDAQFEVTEDYVRVTIPARVPGAGVSP